jgi:hypothetical protein
MRTIPAETGNRTPVAECLNYCLRGFIVQGHVKVSSSLFCLPKKHFSSTNVIELYSFMTYK